MYIPPPEHPDMNLIRERHRREAADRDARNGRFGRGMNGLTTGDKIIFTILVAAALAGIWLLFLWMFV